MNDEPVDMAEALAELRMRFDELTETVTEALDSLNELTMILDDLLTRIGDTE